ncbi:hypothetical protein P691DRAFT_767257 [Macrolepiota fuliginosa MF-IS2]|uniref:Uncharacterized protein n=1 Tax=Macrolepiota fuliginosa MF-IS2 TaxID=1400762 RepID=A0A9P6BWQ8_9AGAR|nr:hypothetical protein P691DRAFT_767257 [Macrolepiota fuliginosa MF-IS2]
MSLQHSHAALLHGGFLWRIAVEYVSLSEAVQGPWGIYNNNRYMFTVKDADGVEYVDDNLTVNEMDILCGVYLTFTGIHDQTVKLSWYPLAYIFDGSGEDVGHWTDHNKMLWEKWNKSILNPNQDKLWGFGGSQCSMKQVEAWSKEVLDEVIGKL